ncbi:hypothetical protein SALBM217S_04275 [Streptomyces griseoloalbus]
MILLRAAECRHRGYERDGKGNQSFEVERFSKVVELVITAMDISICFADFPTQKIGENTRAFRQLGIGYANLGALLMATGHAYDSDGGRALAGAITSLMTGTSYKRSAELAAVVGPYDGYARNAQPHLRVMKQHSDENAKAVRVDDLDTPVWAAATEAWQDVLRVGEKNGFRNSQASVIAPTGTIGLAMSCDTTGLEPDLALVKFKKLVGGGSMQIVNGTVPQALRRLGYQEEQIEAIVARIADHGNVIDAPGLRHEHYEVRTSRWASAPSPRWARSAVDGRDPAVDLRRSLQDGQPAGIGDHRGRRRGLLRGLEDGRQGARHLQRLQGRPAALREDQGEGEGRGRGEGRGDDPRGGREGRRVPSRPQAASQGASRHHDILHRRRRQGYMTANSYPDDGLGEVFLKMSKQGSTLAGMMDAFSIAVSVGLQYGVPLETYVSKFTNMRFEPAGMTDDPDVRMAQSIVDYIFRRLALDFLPFETRSALGIHSAEERQRHLETGSYEPSIDEVEVDVEGLAQSAPRAQELKAVATPKAEAGAGPARPAAGPHQRRARGDAAGYPGGRPAVLLLRYEDAAGRFLLHLRGCGSTSGCS